MITTQRAAQNQIQPLVKNGWDQKINLSLEPGYPFSLEWDDQQNMEIALDKKGENEYQ